MVSAKLWCGCFGGFATKQAPKIRRCRKLILSGQRLTDLPAPVISLGTRKEVPLKLTCWIRNDKRAHIRRPTWPHRSLASRPDGAETDDPPFTQFLPFRRNNIAAAPIKDAALACQAEIRTAHVCRLPNLRSAICRQRCSSPPPLASALCTVWAAPHW